MVESRRRPHGSIGKDHLSVSKFRHVACLNLDDLAAVVRTDVTKLDAKVKNHVDKGESKITHKETRPRRRLAMALLIPATYR